MKTRKIISMILAAVMVVSILSACGSTAPTATIDGKKVTIENVMTINGRDISYPFYRYTYFFVKSNMDQGNETYWTNNPDAAEALKGYALSNVQSVAAAKDLCDKYGAQPTEAELKTIDDQITSDIDSMGSYATFQQTLAQNYLTEDLYREVLSINVYMTALQNKLFSEGGEFYLTESEAAEKTGEDFIRSKHILIKNGDENKEALIKEIQEKIANGEDFDALVTEYNQDTGSDQAYPDGSFYTEGTMITSFYEKAKETAVNEIGEVDTEEYGYFFIKRLPVDAKFISGNIAQVRSAYQSKVWNDIFEETMAAQVIEYNEYYDKLDMNSMK